MEKTTPTAPLVKRLVPSALSLPTALCVPSYPVCEEQKCVDVATSDSSMLAPDCLNWTSGDSCKAMCAADCTSSAGTLTGTLDDGNGSVAIIGSLPKCLAALCAMDDIPCCTSHDCDGIAFLDSFCASCLDDYAPVDVTSSTLSCGYNGFLVSDTTPFYAVCALFCPSSALLNDDTVEGSDCVVTCTDGYIVARDTETTLTYIFDSELDGPNAVFGESCTDSCFDGNAAISGTAASTVWTCGSEGPLVSDKTFPCPTCRGSPIVDTGMVFCAEEYPAVSNDTSTVTCSHSSSDKKVDWEGQVPFCRVVTGGVIASLRVAFSVCFSFTYSETSVVRSSASDTGAGDKNPTPMGRSFDETKLDPSDRLALPPGIKTALRRLHVSLGHLTNDDVTRCLPARGALMWPKEQ